MSARPTSVPISNRASGKGASNDARERQPSRLLGPGPPRNRKAGRPPSPRAVPSSSPLGLWGGRNRLSRPILWVQINFLLCERPVGNSRSDCLVMCS